MRLLPFLAAAVFVACTTGTSTAPPRETPSGVPSAALDDDAYAALPARLLFHRRLQADAGTVEALLLLDPARADLAQMPDTGGLGDPEDIEWSPDGARILTAAPDGNETVLLVIPVDGSAPMRIAVGTMLAPDGAWSPDSRFIAFSREGTEPPAATPSAAPNLGSSAIVVVTADGSGERAVAEGVRPSWSPDGRRLAFFRVDGSGSETLWALDLEAGTEQRLAGGFLQPGQGVIGDIAKWSPDGTALIAVGDGSGCALCLVGADGGGVRPIAADTLAAAIPSGATDIAVVGWIHDGSVLVVARGPASAVIRIGVDDGTVRPVLTIDAVVDHVALAPGSGSIAFARLDPATMTPSIWFVRLDGSGLRQLTRPPSGAGDQRPRWQPSPVAVPWPAFTLPEPTPTPSMVAGIVDLVLTEARVATVTVPASCGPRGDGVSGIEAEGQGFTVQIGLGPDGGSTHFSVGFEGFMAFTGKGFEAAPPYVVVEPGSTSVAGAITFSDLPNAIGDGGASTISGRAAWRCGAVAS